jgi:membrane-associated phospholipid phosphatase
MTELEHQTESEEENNPGRLERFLDFLLKSRQGRSLVVLIVSLLILLAMLPLHTRRSLLRGLLARPVLESLLVAFILLILSFLWTSGAEFDLWLFTAINQRWFRRKWAERTMFWITQIGNGLFGLVLAVLFYVNHQRGLGLQLLLGGLTLWIVVEAVKAITERARPFKLMGETRVIGWRERGNSFPSGHTAQTFFMVSMLSHHFGAGLGLNILLYTIAVLVGFSRIYIGMHYPRDVLGGAVTGSVWSILMVITEPYWAIWRM